MMADDHAIVWVFAMGLAAGARRALALRRGEGVSLRHGAACTAAHQVSVILTSKQLIHARKSRQART
jgi:hypothetical protein